MNESDFTRRIETNLQRGMASVPLPAAEPARARYRIAAGQVVRRPATRVTVAFAATGIALLASLGAAAAADKSPIAVVSTAVHSIEVLAGQILNPAASDPAPIAPVQQPTPGEPAGSGGSDNNDPSASGPATVPLPSPGPEVAPQPEPDLGMAPLPAGTPKPGPMDSPTPNTSPSPATDPTPVPSDNPTPVPSDSPTPVPSDNPTPVPSDNPAPVPSDNPAANGPDSATANPAPPASPDPTLDPTMPF